MREIFPIRRESWHSDLVGESRGVLRHRDFRLLWFGETTSKLGSNVSAVALPLVAVAVLHAGTLAVGILTAAAWLPWLLLGLPAGAWIDRMPRRPVLLACDLVSALLFASVPVAAWFGVLGIGQLLVVALLAGAVSVLFSTAYRVYFSALVTPAEMPAAMATLQASESVAQLSGRGMAGLLAQWFGAVLGLLVDAVSFVVSLACLLLIRTREPAIALRARESTLGREIRAGLRLSLGDPYLRTITLFAALANLALTGYQAMQVLFLLRVLDVPPAAVGWLVACSSTGGILGSLLVSRITRRLGTARGLLVTLLCTGPGILLVPLAGKGIGVILLIFGTLASGVGVAAANVIASSFRQVYTPKALLGRSMSIASMIGYGASPLGALLAGIVGTVLGIRPAIAIMAGLYVLACLTPLASPIRGRRDLPDSAPAMAN